MARLLIAVIVLAAAVTLYGLFDCLLRDRGLVRVLPKPVWALIILFIPVLGFILWYLFGRGSENKPSGRARPRGQVAPDDDPDYLRQVDRDVKLGKHVPPAQGLDEDTTAADSADSDDDSDSADSSADTDDRGTKGEGRGRSN